MLQLGHLPAGNQRAGHRKHVLCQPEEQRVKAAHQGVRDDVGGQGQHRLLGPDQKFVGVLVGYGGDTLQVGPRTEGSHLVYRIAYRAM